MIKFAHYPKSLNSSPPLSKEQNQKTFAWLLSNQSLFLSKTDPFSSIQFSSVTQSCPNICDPMDHRMLGLPVLHQLPEFTQTQVHQVSDAIQSSHPLSPISPPAINLSPNSVLFKLISIRWPKDWSFSFNISPSNEHSGWISFRMDWLDLLAVQGTLKSLLQHHSSKA